MSDNRDLRRQISRVLHDLTVQGKEREVIQEWIRELVSEFFNNTQSNEMIRKSIYDHLEILLNKLEPEQTLRPFLSAMTRSVRYRLPHNQLQDIDPTYIVKAAMECSLLGNTFQIAKCLLEVGQYALEIYKAYSTKKGQENEFGQHVVTETRKLLNHCAPMITNVLLSAIIGYLFEGFAQTWVGDMIYLASYVIFKVIEWADSPPPPYDQIVRDMRRDFANEETRSTVIFKTLEDVEALRRQQIVRRRCNLQ